MKTFVGIVVKIIDDKTIKVKVERVFTHPIYRKRLKKTKNYLVHVINKLPNLKEEVQFIESRPFSKMKNWILKDK